MIRFTIFAIIEDKGWTNKSGSPLVISLWLLAGPVPVSGQACGMRLSGSLLCFLFPPLPSCHIPGQTNNSAVQLNTNCQANSTSISVCGRGQSSHSCVKYYPSVGTEVSSDHFKYVLRRHGGGWLSARSAVNCVDSEWVSNPVLSLFGFGNLCGRWRAY